MYKKLLNQSYLYLLQNPQTKVNCSEVGKILGINRKTVARQLSEIENYDNDLGIINFHNEISNKYERALSILKDIDNTCYNLNELSKLLGVSDKTLSPYYANYYKKEAYKSEPDGGVYAIFKGKECIYIGFSKNVKQRLNQHKSNIDNKSALGVQLYEYCIDHNLMSQDLRFVVLCRSDDLTAMKELEQNLYNNFQPCGNEIIK